MQNNNIETVAAPVGTVRKFVSQQYLSDYKTSTLDKVYATKTLASASVDGLMSKSDKAKLDGLGSGDTCLKVSVPKSSWTLNNGVYYATVNHNLTSEILYITGKDKTTNENVLLSYKVLSNSSIQLSAMSTLDLEVTLVVKGQVVGQVTTSIDDASTSSTSTWSSNKINRTIQEFGTNSQFNITIPASSWTQDGLLFSNTVTHNLNKKILYIGAYDNATKQSLFISYVIVNNNSVKLSIEEKVEAVVTIVFEGGIVNIASGSIDDTTSSLATTWSSNKINSMIPTQVATTTTNGLMSADDKVNINNNTSNIKNIQSNITSLQSTKFDKSSITYSTSNPSGGKHGDIWFKYKA